ncbi:phage tail tube protein [Enterococcus faecalis]|uniref:phage tail tube protein n=1 Tax=Enterococcus faecalis TaxID=1351 RepID=UPI003D130E12
MAFNNNYKYKFEIGADEKKLFPIAGGITSHDTDFSEEDEDIYYYDLNGGSEKYYTGISVAYSYSGHRSFGDEGQEFIRDKVFKLTDRDCFFRVTEPDGRVISGPATIGGIKISGGDANARPDFECTITFKGLPSDTKKENPSPEQSVTKKNKN